MKILVSGSVCLYEIGLQIYENEYKIDCSKYTLS